MDAVELIDLDRALDQLADAEPRLARLVEVRPLRRPDHRGGGRAAGLFATHRQARLGLRPSLAAAPSGGCLSSPAAFQRLRQLFEQLSEVPLGERAAEIERLAEGDAILADELRAMLALSVPRDQHAARRCGRSRSRRRRSRRGAPEIPVFE